jgi:hypothetical protein
MIKHKYINSSGKLDGIQDFIEIGKEMITPIRTIQIIMMLKL